MATGSPTVTEEPTSPDFNVHILRDEILRAEKRAETAEEVAGRQGVLLAELRLENASLRAKVNKYHRSEQAELSLRLKAERRAAWYQKHLKGFAMMTAVEIGRGHRFLFDLHQPIRVVSHDPEVREVIQAAYGVGEILAPELRF